MMKMKRIIHIISILFVCSSLGWAQTGINTTSPSAKAELEIYSTSKGVLLPVLTDAEMLAISSPATGLIVYNSTKATYYYYNGSIWNRIGTKGNILTDTDGDTKIQVEKTSDDDNVRIDLGNNVGAPYVNYGLVNTNGYTVNGNYTIQSGKNLKIGSTPFTLTGTKSYNGTVLATDGNGNWTWKEAHGGLGIASGIESMYFAEAFQTTSLGSDTYFTPVIPFSSISVDTLEFYIEAIAGSPSLRVAIYKANGDTLATSNTFTPSATGLNTGRLRGANYGSTGYSGVLLEPATLYYFAITCVNNSGTTVRSYNSSTNPFNLSAASKIPQPMSGTSTSANCIWMTGF